jgi:hypothetical protein
MVAMQDEIEKLKDKTYEELKKEYANLIPENFPKTHVFLLRTIAYKLQERKYDQLKIKYRKVLEESTDRTKKQKVKYELDQGQKITKEYRGKKYEVFVYDKKYTYNGQEFNSLSQIAKLITGKHLSGPLFFNLRKRKNG